MSLLRSQTETLSASSGAAKKRAKKAAAAAAAADPPSFLELVTAVLPSFMQRNQRSVYRSILRVAVKKIDPVITSTCLWRQG